MSQMITILFECDDYFLCRLDKLGEDGKTTSNVDWSANGTYSSYLYAERAKKVYTAL